MNEEAKKAIDLLKFYEGFFENIGHEEEVKSIESVINYIEKLQKENEELKVCYRQSKVEIENLREKRDKYYLLISKIREKLSHYEGLKKSEFQKHFEETGLPGNDFVDAVLAISRISLLKELLGEE